MRFALYEAKVGIVTMLRKYRLKKTSTTPDFPSITWAMCWLPVSAKSIA